MRQSKLFTKTTKTISSDMKAVSHKFLHQAGFIRESVAGRYYFLPLGIIVRDKIQKIIEIEMNMAGAIKMITPVLHPIELWEETNRTNSVGFELMKVKDRNGSEFALGGTAEEMVIDLVRKFNLSYKDLPFNIYQFSQKFRDELRARGGLLRVREFMMKDAYSFHVDAEDFQNEYKKMQDTYKRIFDYVHLKTFMIESDGGYIGGDYCHEFVMESKIGESRFFISEDESYVAQEDVAKFKKENKNTNEEEKDIQEVKAKRGNTMEDGVKFHKLPLWQQIKDVMFVDEKERIILAIIRGDLDVNECKLKKIINSNKIRHATDKEIRELGSEPGFISPIGMKKGVMIVADDSLRTIKNAYGGANKKDTDLLNINIDRDYKPNIEGDIAMASDGCIAENGKKLIEKNGIEVGHVFQLGYHYSKKMKGANFTDKDGKEKPFYMGCYGIGLDRTMATIVEAHHDDKGIIWPEEVAPFKVHLISLNKVEVADKIYNDLVKNNIEVLYDDREGSAGEKFADADLIGCPYRLVVSEKTLKEDSVELKKRSEEKCELVKIDQIVKLLNS